jgi:hypothetical protein
MISPEPFELKNLNLFPDHQLVDSYVTSSAPDSSPTPTETADSITIKDDHFRKCFFLYISLPKTMA